MRSILQNLRLGFRSILHNKVRSVLTMLGIIIGVSQIIVLIGLGRGVEKGITGEITQLGSNILFVLSGKVKSGSGTLNPGAAVGTSTLTLADLTAIRAIPDIIGATPIGMVNAVPVTGSLQAPGTIVLATDANYFDLTGMYTLVGGRFFSEKEAASAARVIVLGRDATATLFPQVPPESVPGKTVQLGKETFTVVGTVQAKDTQSLFSSSGNTPGIALMPFLAAKQLNPNTQIFRMALKAKESLNMKDVAKEVQATLVRLHGTDDTTVFTQEDLLSVVDNILGIITKAIVGLASISLVVGGIGIMNIMLVSVTERTKEIGLRKAVGASDTNILVQFLTESVLLGLFGGFFGVGIAFIAAVIVHANVTGLTIVVDAQSIGIATLFSLAVGVLFGVAPAIRASRLNPIDALRYE